MQAKLPPNPKGIRVLKTIESDRLTTMYPSLPPSPKQCPTCGGTKQFLWYDDHDNIVSYECSCAEQWILYRYLLYNGIERGYQRMGWRDIRTDTEIARSAKAYITDWPYNFSNGFGLYLHGTPGTGKTLLGTLVLKHVLGQGYEGHFTTFNELLDGYMGTWGDADAKAWFTRKVKNTGLLVIDDPGRENRESKGSISRSTSLLDDVIRHRIAANLPTIITTNETPEDFSRAYGPNLKSLLSERMEVREATGVDYRSTKRREVESEREAHLTRPLVLA